MRPAAFLPALVALAAAHGNHDVEKEMLERREFLMHSRSNLNHCADKIAERGLEKRAMHRRAEFANRLAKRNGLEGRDLTELLDVSHLSEEDYTIDTDPSVLFAGNKSCVLNPEATEGPFYVAGEFVRQDITDDEAGVPLAVDVQVLDVETCEPVPGAYLEIWHCNSTGVYSGVVSAMNGAGLADESNVDATFHRGIQKLDDDGAAQFNTFFPGHYAGRAIHIHIMLHMGAEERENGTLSDLTAAHVGQMYFDQDLISEVEALEPYSGNEQPLTQNADDFILAGEAADTDPFMHYVRLGEGIEDGLLAWLAVGVNTTFERTVSAAAEKFEEGGKVNENAGFGGGCFGGGMPPFPTGTDFPGGFPMPTGTDLPDFPGGFPGGGCEASGEAGPEESAPAEPEPEEPVEGEDGAEGEGEE